MHNFITFSLQTLQREVRKLLAEGKIATYEKGEIVVRLIEQEDVDEEEALIFFTLKLFEIQYYHA